MGTCAPATVETVPDTVFLLPLPAVIPLASRTLCAILVLLPALPSVVLVDGVGMTFLGVRASPTH